MRNRRRLKTTCAGRWLGRAQCGGSHPHAGTGCASRHRVLAEAEQDWRLAVRELILGQARTTAHVRVLRERGQGDCLGITGKTITPIFARGTRSPIASLVRSPTGGAGRLTTQCDRILAATISAGRLERSLPRNRRRIECARSALSHHVHLRPFLARSELYVPAVRPDVRHRQLS